MFDKSIKLNFQISSKEFILGVGIAVFSGLLMYQDLNRFPFSSNGILSLIALGGFIAAPVFFVMGFYKLFYKSLFSDEANLYMSLPISNLHVVLSKVFVASFWLIILFGVLIFTTFSSVIAMANGEGLFNFLIDSFLLDGVAPSQVGGHMLLLLWADIISVFVFSATLLFAIIFANTLNVKQFRIGLNLLVVLICFAVNGFIFYNINQRLNLQLAGLLVALAMLLVFVYLSVKLLTEKYNL